MSKLELLLGRNYKWWYLIIFSFKSNIVYRWNSLMWLSSSVVMILGTLLVWYINFSQQNNFEQNFSQIFTYFIIGESFIFGTAIQFDIGENIQDGKLTNRLLQPTNCFNYYIVHCFGYQLFENFSKLFIYLLVGLIFSKFLIFPGLPSFFLFLILNILAYIITTLIGIIVGLTAFWLTAFYGSAGFFDSLKHVFSGRLFPLNALQILYPTLFFPFAFTFFHPMQIYLGKYDPMQALLVFLGGIIWCILLYFLANFVFKLGLRRNESVGL